jgi:hypothetical protein
MSESPYFSGDPGRNRTCDLQLRRLLLYPLSYGANPSAPSTDIFAAVRNVNGVEFTAAQPADRLARSLLTKESKNAEG